MSSVTKSPEVGTKVSLERAELASSEVVPEDTVVTQSSEALISDQARQTMQLDAVADASAESEDEDEQELIEPKVMGMSGFRRVFANLMVTFDMTRGERFSGLNGLKALSSVQFGPEVYNLYNPLRKAGIKKGSEDLSHVGLFRNSFGRILDVAEAVSHSHILVLGKNSDVHQTLRSALAHVIHEVEGTFPCPPDYSIAQIPGSEDGTVPADDLKFSDLISVHGWLNSTGSDEGSSLQETQMVLNFRLNVPNLYDTKDPLKYLTWAESILRNILKSRDNSDSSILFAINMDPADLAKPESRELVDMVLTEGGFTLFTRNELSKPNVADWLPTTKVSLNRDLLSPNGDLLFVKVVGAVEEEVEAE